MKRFFLSYDSRLVVVRALIGVLLDINVIGVCRVLTDIGVRSLAIGWSTSCPFSLYLLIRVSKRCLIELRLDIADMPEMTLWLGSAPNKRSVSRVECGVSALCRKDRNFVDSTLDYMWDRKNKTKAETERKQLN